MRLQMTWVTVGVRAVMELGIVSGFAYWGYQIGNGPVAKALLAAAAVLVGFGFWGAVDFHQAGRWAEWLRLTQELLISGVAAAAWWAGGSPALGVALALLSIVYHTVVYAAGGRLLPAP